MIEKLKGKIPDNIYNELPEVVSKFKIDTPLRLAHFLSETSHESANYKVFLENLNYSEEALLRVFPKYFNTTTAKAYARNPQKIANKVYANRMGNGDEASGDGWKFRGHGAMQLTGRKNYELFDAYVPDNIIDNPDLVSSKYPLLSAAWFWYVNNINVIADKGEDVTAVRKKINGGTIGLDDVKKQFIYFFNILK